MSLSELTAAGMTVIIDEDDPRSFMLDATRAIPESGDILVTGSISYDHTTRKFQVDARSTTNYGSSREVAIYPPEPGEHAPDPGSLPYQFLKNTLSAMRSSQEQQ